MTDWPAVLDPLPPLGNDAHVWSVSLDNSDYDIESCRKRLSSGEQARAEKFKFPRDRKRYIIAHAAVRDILSRYTLTESSILEFSICENGKPKLAAPFCLYDIEFNLSHSHERALLAVNHQDELGVDIEYVKADFEVFEIAQRFFSASEVAALRALPEALQCRAFYKCWTSKEAFLKARGTGLSGKLDEVEVGFDGMRVRITASVAGWALQELNCSDGYEAALVTQHAPKHIVCYGWQPTN